MSRDIGPRVRRTRARKFLLSELAMAHRGIELEGLTARGRQVLGRLHAIGIVDAGGGRVWLTDLGYRLLAEWRRG